MYVTLVSGWQGGIATVPFLARQHARTPDVARLTRVSYSRDVGEQTHKHILQERRLSRNGGTSKPHRSKYIVAGYSYNFSKCYAASFSKTSISCTSSCSLSLSTFILRVSGLLSSPVGTNSASGIAASTVSSEMN